MTPVNIGVTDCNPALLSWYFNIQEIIETHERKRQICFYRKHCSKDLDNWTTSYGLQTFACKFDVIISLSEYKQWDSSSSRFNGIWMWRNLYTETSFSKSGHLNLIDKNSATSQPELEKLVPGMCWSSTVLGEEALRQSATQNCLRGYVHLYWKLATLYDLHSCVERVCEEVEESAVV